MKKQKDRYSTILHVLFIMLLSGSASAGSVYLNGKNIDGVINQKFEKVDIFIDAAGNVHITAPGYNVIEEEEASTSSGASKSGPNPDLNNRYFIVTQQSSTGAAQYDVEIFINGHMVRKIHANDPQLIKEVSRYMKPGPNQVKIRAVKDLSGGRKSVSASDEMRVIIGMGQTAGQQVTINARLVEFVCTARDTEVFDRDYKVQAR